MHALAHLNKAIHLQRGHIHAEAYINQGHSQDKSISHHGPDRVQNGGLQDVNQSQHVISVRQLFRFSHHGKVSKVPNHTLILSRFQCT